MYRIENKILENELKYKGDVILRYKIQYPQIFNKKKFNKENYDKAMKLQKETEEKVFDDAKKTYEYNKKNGYPIMVFEVDLSYEITENTEKIVSLYYDEYRFTGGAHGSTVRTSQTWDMIEEKKIVLNQWFKDLNYVSKIITYINQQIKKNIDNGNNIYFDNYCCLTSEFFRVENYYVKSGRIFIYYQQYDIAPYSSGIINFELKKDKNKNI